MNQFQDIFNIFNIQPSMRRIRKSSKYIPAILEDYYSILGHYEFNYFYNQLLLPDELFTENGYTTFYLENQNVVHWAFKNDDPSNDPSVYQSSDGENFFLEADSLSGFLVSMAYFQGLMGGLEYCDEYEIDFFNTQYEKLKHLFSHKENCTNPFMGIEYFGTSPMNIVGVTKYGESYKIMYGASTESFFGETESLLNSCI